MSESQDKQDTGIENFINKHLVKLLWGVALYYVISLSNDFKDVKVTLQQLLINQATTEARIVKLEESDKAKTVRWEQYDNDKADFYKTYKLNRKDE